MRALSVLTFFCLSAGYVSAVIPTIYVWQGDEDGAGDGTWSNSSHWQNGNLPTNEGEDLVFFPGSFGEDFDDNSSSVDVDTNVDVLSLFFDEQVDYSFYSSTTGTEIRIGDRIQASSGEYDSEVYFGSGLMLIADGDDIVVDVGYGVEIEIAGAFAMGPESRTEVTGGGTLLLSGDNSHGSLAGVISVTEGYLGLGHNFAAGGTSIELGDAENPGSNFAGLMAVDGDRRIANNVLVHGYIESVEDDYERHELNFDGVVTFSTDTQLYNYGGLMNFLGGVAEVSSGTQLSIWADDPVIFTGPTGITGGIHMEDGVALFSDINALPDAAPGTFFTSGEDDTYIGLMIDSGTDRFDATGQFLALFDPAGFTGSIGFDTDPGNEGALNTYTAPIDLTGFTDVRIGSVTGAGLTGTITPSGENYRFGGGGGTLLVGSLLEDVLVSDPVTLPAGATESAAGTVAPRGLEVVSTQYDPLTVYINNSENSFTGNVVTEHSAVIFGNAPGTLPSAATLSPGSGGYIGLQDTTRSIASYLSQFDPSLDRGIIGFDSPTPGTNREITELIDLSIFTSSTPDFYIGTATNVTLSGGVFPASAGEELRFAGFKGGELTVASNIFDPEDTMSVVIGDIDSPATDRVSSAGSDEEQLSTVRLSGTNSYSGGTRLEAGQLIVTSNASLGTGDLTVAGNGEGGFIEALIYVSEYEFEGGDFDFGGPILSPEASDLVLPNSIQLNSILEVDVQIALTDENLTLAGDIEGSGGIDKNGNGTLTLSGDNSEFEGGLYISEGTVNIAGDTSAGSGPIGFGSGSGQNLNFTSMDPVIGGLYEILDDEDEYSSYSSANVNLANGSTLTIDVDGFFLDFPGSIEGEGSLRLTGNGTQSLSGYNSFTGGLQVASGANLVVRSSSGLGNGYPDAPTVTLDGGSLTLASDGEESSIEANIIFGANGGEIRGNGMLSFNDPLAIGSGVSISPGLSVGKIEFDGPLELGELGSLTVEIGDGDDANEIISDVVYANTIDITATNLNPFSISLTGEDSELPTNFDSMQAYSWSVLLAGAAITDFDVTAFNLSVSSALQSAGGEGLWSLQLASSGNEFGETFLTNNVLQLNFTPVPEPSTFALVALGLSLVTFQAGRRRRPSR